MKPSFVENTEINLIRMKLLWMQRVRLERVGVGKTTRKASCCNYLLETSAVWHRSSLSLRWRQHPAFWCPFHLQTGGTPLNVGNLRSTQQDKRLSSNSVNQVRVSAVSLVVYTTANRFENDNYVSHVHPWQANRVDKVDIRGLGNDIKLLRINYFLSTLEVLIYIQITTLGYSLLTEFHLL